MPDRWKTYYIDGGAGDDTLLGMGDADTLLGGSGSDTLTGHAASDTLIGGTGVDVLDGAGGQDRFNVTAGDIPAGETEHIAGGAGSDTIYLNGFNISHVTGSAPNFLVTDAVTGGTYEITSVENIVFA